MKGGREEGREGDACMQGEQKNDEKNNSAAVLRWKSGNGKLKKNRNDRHEGLPFFL